jgi:NAD(P)-dependent dehydrogenase (short-subunit alcohol dehydrogenase family)
VNQGNQAPSETRVALITGAASGIGAACARRVADIGITVVGLDVDDEQGHVTFAELGAPHQYRRLDVRDSDQWLEVVASIREDFGRLDIFHLNAGVMSRPKGLPLLDDALDWLTPEAYRKVMSVNLDGVVFGLIAALSLPDISQVVITASGAAVLPLPMDPYYTASKYAVLGLGLAVEKALEDRGIRLDILCPGAIDTPLTAPDIRAAVKQEPASLIADSVAELLTTDRRGPVWLAFNEAEGMQRYDPPGLPGVGDALDIGEAVAAS